MEILQISKALNKKLKIKNQFKKLKTSTMTLMIYNNYKETKAYMFKIQDKLKKLINQIWKETK